MRRLGLVIVLVCSLAACGGKKNGPSVGGGDDDNEEISDAGDAGGGLEDIGGTGEQDTSRPDVNDGEPDMTVEPDPDLGEPDLGVPDTGDAPDMTTADMNPAEDMGACPPRAGAQGDPCDCDEQCTSGACIAETETESGFCSVPCADRADCNQGSGACLPDPDTGLSYCWPDDTGSDCTTNTAADPSKCEHAICIEAGPNHVPEEHFCSLECDDATDCGVGRACSPVRCRAEPSGFSCLTQIQILRSGTKDALLTFYPDSYDVCVPLGEQVNADCEGSATNEYVCLSGLCDPSTDRCTAECQDTADCPVGGCVDRDTSDPDLAIRVCDL